jgi:glutamate carboxypeptidase
MNRTLNPAAWIEHFRSRLPAMLAEVRALVEHESPSGDKPALDALADLLEWRLTELGCAVGRIRNEHGGDILSAAFLSSGDGPCTLVLGHFDTVWPRGTLASMPARVEGEQMQGPGVYDMKANLAMILAVLDAFRTLGARPSRPLHVMLTSDEEIGSPSSRTWIERMASEAAHVLVPEPPLANGGLKTARKGVGRFTVKVQGKASHAGVAPEAGASAIVELAHQVLKIHALNDLAAGTTVNVGVVRGGTAVNVVPAMGVAELDVRVTTRAAAEAAEQALRGFEPVTPGTQVHVDGHFNRPPMERTPAIAALFERARVIARGLGIELTEGATGGASDGNFTAALGVPTLDGLGVIGGGAHAADEHILVDSLPERAALLAALILEL